MRRAIEEIQSLRRQNEILSAKVSVMDLFSVVLHTPPNYPSVSMGEDIVWAMQKELTKPSGLNEEN